MLSTSTPSSSSSTPPPNSSQTALISVRLAALECDEAAVAYHLACGADVNQINDHFIHRESKFTALHHAAEWRNVPILKRLLAAPNINVNAKGVYGWTPLHVAARYNRRPGAPTAVRLLCRAGADVWARDEDGRTPLHFAAARGTRQIVFTLLNEGQNVTLGEEKGEEGEDDERTEGKVTSLVRSVLDAVDDSGYTPLCTAFLEHPSTTAEAPQEAEVLRCLLQNGADVNAQQQQPRNDCDHHHLNQQLTPLHIVAMSSRSSAVAAQLLLDAGADVSALAIDYRDESMPLRTPLAFANVFERPQRERQQSVDERKMIAAVIRSEMGDCERHGVK